MPGKKSRKAEDSDSDSGPDDRNPPQNAAKKQKTSSSSNLQKNDEGGYTFELSKMRQVNVKDFKGKKMRTKRAAPMLEA